MYILNQKIKNKSDFISNLKFINLDGNTLKRKYLKKGSLKHTPSSVKEWYNSVYSLEKNNYMKILPLKDKFIYKVFDIYFNLNKLKEHDVLSMSKIFVGKPEVKHYNNKIHITLYIYNKWIMRFYHMTNMIKGGKILFSLKNKQFIMLENKPFVMAVLLLKRFEFNKKSITFVKDLLIRVFSNNSTNNKFIEVLYTNLITFFDKVELCDLLGLNKGKNIDPEKFFINEYVSNKKIKVINWDLFKVSRFNKQTKENIYVYLCIMSRFFNYIGFPKMINVLRKVLLLHKYEEKDKSLLIKFLEGLRKTYLTKLNVNSMFFFIWLAKFYLDLNKILRSIYLVKWYKRNIYYIRHKFNIKNILSIKSILNKLYNNKIEINIISLKYLYLDGNILALTVVRKLKNRKRRVLKVIRMALKLSKKPYINKFYTDSLNVNSLDTVFIKKDSNLLINNNIPLNRDLAFKPISYKSRTIFYYLKHKIISGLKLQGTGRLTKRLTASRSISKSIGKGSLKNRASSYNGLSTVILRGYVKSNLQYVNINSHNRIGAYGIKSWISSY